MSSKLPPNFFCWSNVSCFATKNHSSNYNHPQPTSKNKTRVGRIETTLGSQLVINDVLHDQCFTFRLYFISRLGKILSYGSDSTTPGEKSSSSSAREFSSTSPSDVTVCEDDISVGEEHRRNCDTTILQEAVKTLRNEIQELQTKHEVQFMTFSSKFVEHEQG